MSARVFLSPNQVLDLAVLGVTSERPRTAAEVVAAVRRFGGGHFQPIPDVILGRVAALVEDGLLASAPGPSTGAAYWRPSAAGQARLERLLLMPSGAPGHALAAVGACLKICFLELLRADARDAVLQDLLAAHRRALDEARAALADRSCQCALVRRCLARDVAHREAELCWIEASAGASASVPRARL